MLVKTARYAYVILAWIFLLGVLVQVFIAGLGVFGRSRQLWNSHRELGHYLGLPLLLMLILVFLGRLPKAARRRTVLLFVVYLALADFVIYIRSVPLVTALHPVLALILSGMALRSARSALALPGMPAETPLRKQPSTQGGVA